MQNLKLSLKMGPSMQMVIVEIRKGKLTKFWRTLKEKECNGCGVDGDDGLARVEPGVNGKPRLRRMILWFSNSLSKCRERSWRKT